MRAYRYKLTLPATDDTHLLPQSFFVMVLAINGETAKAALKQHYPQENLEIEWDSITDTLIQA